MSSSFIVECRQKETDIVIANGSYTTNLQEEILIEEGDSIYVKQSFVDTEAASNNQIVISDDLTLSTSNFVYLNYDNNTDLAFVKNVGDKRAVDPNVGFNWGDLPAIDYQNYVLCNQRNAGDSTHVVGLQTTRYDTNKPILEATLKYQYEDISGATVFFTAVFKITDKNFVEAKPTPFIAKNGTVKSVDYTEAQLISLFNWKPGMEIEGVAIDDWVAEPITFNNTIELSKGNYDPAQLITVLNRELQKNAPTTSDILVSSYLKNGATFVGTASIGNLFSLARFDGGNSGMQLNDINKRVIGASQVNLDYDPATKQFSWIYTHTPTYSSGNEVVTYRPDGITQNKSGGILFRELSAIIKGTTKSFDFWNKVMGFDVSTTGLLTTFDIVNINPGGGPGASGTPPAPALFGPKITNFADGITSTGAYIGIADLVDGASASYQTIPDLPFSATSSDTIPIVGSVTSLNHIDAFGYFLIEIDSKFKNEFLTPSNNYRNVQSIVSRYYSVNSYTSGSSDGSIIYTHSGLPTLLQSFRVRILDSTKALATNIGADNTIFVEIMKAPKETKPKKL